MALTFDLSSSGIHIVLVLGFLPLSAMPTVRATYSDGVLSATVEPVPCSHPSALQAAHAVQLQRSAIRSPLDCVSTCLRHSMCTAAAHVQRKDDTSASCVLLGIISREPTVVSEDPDQETCTMHVVNPCPKTSTLFRGHCRCSPETRGQFCHLVNPDDCSASWSKVHSSSGTPSNTDDVIEANKGNKGGYVKVALDKGSNSILVLNGMYFFSDSTTTFASQVTPTLSRKSWDEFDHSPALELRFVTHDGQVQVLNDKEGVPSPSTVITHWFLRQPHVTRQLYTSDANGQATQGSVDDVIQTLKAGKTIVSYDTAHVLSAESKVQLSRYHWEISRIGGMYNFQTSSYWLNTVWTTDGEYDVHRFYIVSDSLKNAQHTTTARELHMDVCWVSGHHDPRDTAAASSTNDNDSNNSTGYLIRATLSGHPVHVVVDDVALAVNQVLVQRDRVYFGTRPYLQLGNGFSALSEEMRKVVSTDGQVFQCQNLPQPGAQVTSTTASANRLQWFVSTRARSRVFSVTSEGEVEQGAEGALYTAVERGASVTLGLTFFQPGHFWLVATDSLELSQGTHVVAMVEGLSRLPIPKGQVTSSLECGLRALLVTSQGKVRIYDYKHKEEGTHETLSDVTVDWFIDSYADT